MSKTREPAQCPPGSEQICPDPELYILYLDKHQCFHAIQDKRDTENTEGLFLLFCLEGKTEICSRFKDSSYEQTLQEGWFTLQYYPKGA
jgi:hypothetical protein